MKKAIQSLIMLTFIYSSTSMQAQPICGTRVSQEEYEICRSLQLQSIPIGKPASADEIKVQFFIACSGATASTGATTIADVNSALTTLNTTFANTGLTFVQCSAPKFMLNSSYFNMTYNSSVSVQQPYENVMCRQFDMLNTINIYILNDISGVAGYTQLGGGAYRRIFIGKGGSANFDTGHTLSHEMGHFFGLLHTCGYGNGGSTNELVNGSNSTTAGDLIQDTPADPAIIAYILSSGPTCTYPFGSPNCSSIPPFCDANNQVYAPLGNNIMFPDICLSFNSLTNGQEGRIWSTYQANLVNKLTGTANLVSRDNWGDPGFEINNLANMGTWDDIWESPDLWNCRTGSTCGSHENPGYLNPSTTDNYLMVRIKNNSCNTSVPAAVHLYWTLGSTGEIWPNAWNTDQLCSINAGGELTPSSGITVPALNSSQEIVLTQNWDPVDPTLFTCTTLLAHSDGKPMICFLERIVSTADPMYNEQTGVHAGKNVKENNNITTRNTSLLALSGNKAYPVKEGIVTQLVKNDFEVTQKFDIEVKNIYTEGDNVFTTFGSIIITLDNALWESWANGGYLGDGITVYNVTKKQVKITDGRIARLKNIEIPARTYREIEFCYFLNQETTSRFNYKYLVSQFLSNSSEVEPIGTSCQYNVLVNAEEGSYKSADNTIANFYVNEKINRTTLYPNPVTNFALLEYSLPEPCDVKIDVYNIAGTFLRTIQLGYRNDRNNIDILDFNELSTGVYLLKIKEGGELNTIKFIKK